jgi:adenylate cyclase
VHEQTQDKLALGYEDRGEQTVKNIARPVHVWRVLVDGSASPHSETPQAPRRYWHAGVFSFVGLAIIAGTIVLVQHLSLRPQPTHASIPPPSPAAIPTVQSSLSFPDKPSIAVLPFANVSGDPSQEYFSDGVTDQLITDLSELPGLFVIDRNSSSTYKGKAVKVQEVGRELGVQVVLEGSARKTFDGVRIAVQLVDATTGANLWAE